MVKFMISKVSSYIYAQQISVNAKAVYIKSLNETNFMRLQKTMQKEKERPGGWSEKTQNHSNPKCLKIDVKMHKKKLQDMMVIWV